MASKAQIKARKLFALRSKRGDFRKKQQMNKSTAKRIIKSGVAIKIAENLKLTKASNKGYLPKIKGYQVCSKCLKNKVGSRQAWFQDFTGQKRVCNACIDEMRKGKNP